VTRGDDRALQVGVRVDGIGEGPYLTLLAGAVDADDRERRRPIEADGSGVARGCGGGFRTIQGVEEAVVVVRAFQDDLLGPVVESAAGARPHDRDLGPLRVFVVPGVAGEESAVPLPAQVAGLAAGTVVENQVGGIRALPCECKPVIPLRRHGHPRPGGQCISRCRIPIVDIDDLTPTDGSFEMDSEWHVPILSSMRGYGGNTAGFIPI